MKATFHCLSLTFSFNPAKSEQDLELILCIEFWTETELHFWSSQREQNKKLYQLQKHPEVNFQRINHI